MAERIQSKRQDPFERIIFEPARRRAGKASRTSDFLIRVGFEKGGRDESPELEAQAMRALMTVGVGLAEKHRGSCLTDYSAGARSVVVEFTMPGTSRQKVYGEVLDAVATATDGAEELPPGVRVWVEVE